MSDCHQSIIHDFQIEIDRLVRERDQLRAQLAQVQNLMAFHARCEADSDCDLIKHLRIALADLPDAPKFTPVADERGTDAPRHVASVDVPLPQPASAHEAPVEDRVGRGRASDKPR